MECCEIFFFSSDKARGHEQRNKFHLYVCEANERDDGDRIFLFINKSNSYADGFEIRKADGYPFLLLDFSFIGCSATVAYLDEYLDGHIGEPVGKLRKEDIDPLITHLEASTVLEDHNIHRISAALRALKD